MRINHNFFSNLAFQIAEENLGKTKTNPSVGCVVVKGNTVISSGCTSINGRPHAEFNALNKKKVVMGFGHRVYRTGDSRVPTMKHYMFKVAKLLKKRKIYKDVRDFRKGNVRPKKYSP